MNNKIFIKKGLVVAVILLFIGVAFAPSTGTKVEEKSSVSDVSNTGVDIGIVEIVAYEWSGGAPGLDYDLCFTAEVKNFGATISGWVYINGTSRYLITGREFDTSSIIVSKLGPGESFCARRGNGVKYPFPFQFPRLYRIKFTVEPTDSNPDNNHLEQVVLIWGFLKSHHICLLFI